MEKELLKTFDENGNARGTATRAEVHREGHWHETFHCWFTEKIGDEHFIFFKSMTQTKKIIPICWILLRWAIFLQRKPIWMV